MFKKGLKYFWKYFRVLSFGFFVVSISYSLYLKWFPPLSTPLMVMRALEAQPNKDGSPFKMEADWVSYQNFSPSMRLAVVASEDSEFPNHFGFDFNALWEAFKHNMNSDKKVGGSTISQQVAKNVFLWQSRSYFRKVLEMYFTLMIEIFWSKKRILEMYLNIAETGNGVFGMQAASRKYFKVDAKYLSPHQAALLAALLPSPRRMSTKSLKVKQKAFKVEIAMRKIGLVYLQDIEE